MAIATKETETHRRIIYSLRLVLESPRQANPAPIGDILAPQVGPPVLQLRDFGLRIVGILPVAVRDLLLFALSILPPQILGRVLCVGVDQALRLVSPAWKIADGDESRSPDNRRCGIKTWAKSNKSSLNLSWKPGIEIVLSPTAGEWLFRDKQSGWLARHKLRQRGSDFNFYAWGAMIAVTRMTSIGKRYIGHYRSRMRQAQSAIECFHQDVL
jgi:hypothetical protein